MKHKALIFDLDGVICTPAYRFAAYLEGKHGLTFADTHPFFAGRFLQCLVGKADLQIEIKPFLELWQLDYTVESFLERWFGEESLVDARLLAMAQTVRTKGIACYVATNQESYRTLYLRQQMGFDHWFDQIFPSTEIGVVKPEILFYQRVTEKVGVEPQQILFWDDAPANVEAARKFGWQAEHYTTFEQFQDRMREIN